VNGCRFILVWGMVIACGLAAVAAPSTESASRKPDPNPERFSAEIAAFEAWDRQNSAPQDAVLFVGSSSIRMWQTAECFPDIPVINRGFGGSHASDVIQFADRIVLKYKPRTIVYYAGDNDIADGKPAEQVADDFQRFVDTVRVKLPDTKIIYLPVKPSLARWRLWPVMQQTNSLVKQLIAGDPHVTYVDTATAMLGPDGKPRPEIFREDGLHMNAKGYRIWTDLLRDELATAHGTSNK
jgi:lysophospholipase L1-like esterase